MVMLRPLKQAMLFVAIMAALAFKAQSNLAPNPSFDNVISCPNITGQWNLCQSWYNCNGNIGPGLWGTPDFYHTCGTPNGNPYYNPVPPNCGMGYCNTHSGGGMIGLINYDAPYQDYREYISAQLNCPMTPGNTYTVSFWVSIGTNPNYKYTINNLGVYLSATQPTQSGYYPISVVPQFEINSVINNTAWAQYTFTISPVSNLNYITLGNFRNDANTTITYAFPLAAWPYANWYIDDIVVTGPPTLSLTSASSNASCNQSDGSATVTPLSPGAYTYSWTPGNYTTSVANTLSAGNYTVVVTSTNCAYGSIVVSVGQNTLNPFTLNSATLNANCSGQGGSATVSPSSPGSYTYNWMPGGYNTSTVSNINAGTYTVSVSSNSCYTASMTINVGQDPPVSFSISGASSSANCLGQNGSATVIPSSPGVYIYTWNPGGYNTSIVSNVNSGTYTVSVSNNSCYTTSMTVNVAQTPPTNFTLSYSYLNADCPNANNGSATVNPSGPGSYTYNWTPGSYTSSVVNNLTMGNYTVTVNNNACTTNSILVSIGSNSIYSNIPLNTNINNVKCFGLANGSATVTPTNTMNVTYNWLPGGYTTQVVSNLSPGIYTVDVTGTGCYTGSTVFTITQPPAMNLAVSPPQEICREQSAIINSTLAGGVAPYNYFWSNGSTFSGITVAPLITTTYTLNIVDANGCTLFAVTTVSVDLCDGISNHAANPDIHIYPNPFTTQINIEGLSGSDEVVIVNTLGQMIFKAKGDEKTFDLSGYTGQIFFIEVLRQDGTLIKTKLIKQ